LIVAAGLSACATGTFRISPDEQLEAEQAANFAEMAVLSTAGIHGTWLTTNWRGGVCRWSKDDPTVAICRTATRRSDDQPWSPTTERYRRDEAGDWKFAPEPNTLRR
jgi:hypothetical protein